jgi:hypothetical protein
MKKMARLLTFAFVSTILLEPTLAEQPAGHAVTD